MTNADGPAVQAPSASNVRGQLLEAGLFLVVVATPLAFLPPSRAPFADIKLLLLLAGVLLVAASRTPFDLRLAAPALVWVLAATASAAAGLDWWWSVMGAEGQSAGLLLFAAAAVLIAVGPRIPDALRARVPGWIVRTGLVVALVAVAGRLVPSLVGGPRLGLAIGSTLGQPVFTAGFLAASLAAAVTVRRGWGFWIVVAILTSGVVVSSNRAGLIGAVAGLSVAAALERVPRRTAVTLAFVFVAVVAGWTVLDRAGASNAPISGVPRFAQVSEGTSANARLHVWSAMWRGFRADPVAGTGPALAHAAFLRHATEREIRLAEPTWTDAHNLALESLVTTGVAGTVPLVVLAAVAAGLILWRRPAQAWAVAVAVALLPTHALQPVSVVLLPLLFLAAGCAVSRRTDAGPQRHALLVGAASVMVILSLLRLGAGILERYGRTYGSTDALSSAHSLEPWRLSSRLALSEVLAFDARVEDPRRPHESDAAARSRALVREALLGHGWHPAIRLVAADSEALLGRRGVAETWLRRQLALYPNDPAAWHGAAELAFADGRRSAALSYARRALELDPDAKRPAQIVRRLTRDDDEPRRRT